MRYSYRNCPPQTRLVIIRHGETYQNGQATIGMGQALPDELSVTPHGRSDEDLNPRGRQQAEMLAEELIRFHFDVAYASPLNRVRETIAPWQSKVSNCDVRFRDELIEMKLDFTSVTPELELRSPNYFQEFLRRIGAKHHDWVDAGNDPDDFRLGNGESNRECRERTVAIYDEILDKHYGESVLIAAHGLVNSQALNYLRQDRDKENKMIEQHNCCINVVVWDDLNQPPRQLVNSVAHLPRSLLEIRNNDEFTLGFHKGRRALAMLASKGEPQEAVDVLVNATLQFTNDKSDAARSSLEIYLDDFSVHAVLEGFAAGLTEN